MDFDRFLAQNQPLWDRLAYLTGRANRRLGNLSAAELDELVRLYQRSSAHLSQVRTYYRDPALIARLTGLVAASGALLYGTRPRTLRTAGRFFTTTFPAAVWHSRRFVAVAAALFYVPAIALGLWLANSPAAVEATGPPALRQAYLDEQFEDYYSSEPAAQFASKVTTNNIRVGFVAFAGGILVCLPTAWILATNGASLGTVAGLFAAAGQNAKFYGLILPHGLLELTAIVIAGAAGLRLGWSVIDPGDRPRKVAVTEEGRRAVVIVLGLVATFAVAGTIEGFVTGSPLPTWARVGVGVCVESAFVAYLVTQGRAAAARGLTGTMDEEDAAGWASLPAPAAHPATPAEVSPSG